MDNNLSDNTTKYNPETLHYVSEYENTLKIINRCRIQFKSVASLLLSKAVKEKLLLFHTYVYVDYENYFNAIFVIVSWTIPTMQFKPRNVSKCSYKYYIETHTSYCIEFFKQFHSHKMGILLKFVLCCWIHEIVRQKWHIRTSVWNRNFLQLKIAASKVFDWIFSQPHNFHTIKLMVYSMMFASCKEFCLEALSF